MNKILCCLIFVLTASITPISARQIASSKQQQIHVLLAADTISDVKKSSHQDLKHMKKELSIISKATGMTLNIKELYNRRLTFKKLKKWILNQKFGSNDIVLLYYTGHGLRTEKSKTVWPAIYLPPKKEIVELNDLFLKLTERSAALYIVFADCCNNYMKGRPFLPKPLLFPEEKSTGYTPSTAGHKKLFCQTRGVIIASGSIPGKRAWCTEKGGVFTNAFLVALRSEFSHRDPQWSRVFRKTKMLCQHFQRPQFQIELKKPKRTLIPKQPVE
jgi:hypothetical protein